MGSLTTRRQIPKLLRWLSSNGCWTSPQYGERWGRHWLDIARYGDSNGSDENHAYPTRLAISQLGHRLRSIAICHSTKFVRDQLAGDLVEPVDPDRITATGFLAIGTKILAEKDPLKKKADIVDEQLDTIGQTRFSACRSDVRVVTTTCSTQSRRVIITRWRAFCTARSQVDREFGEGR